MIFRLPGKHRITAVNLSDFQMAEKISISAEINAAANLVSFQITESNGFSRVDIEFEPESQNPPELQRQGWQAILDNFKRYKESQFS